MVLLVMTTAGAAYEQSFEQTPPGVVEVKVLPAAQTLGTGSGENYFDGSGELFRRLFGYIKRQVVAMTVPVEGRCTMDGCASFSGERTGTRASGTNRASRPRKFQSVWWRASASGWLHRKELLIGADVPGALDRRPPRLQAGGRGLWDLLEQPFCALVSETF